MNIEKYTGSWDQLLRVVRDQVRESDHLDYKSIAYADVRKSEQKQAEDKDELRADVAAFANSGGGWILIGIKESKNLPTGVIGIEAPHRQEEFIRDVLAAKITPPITRYRVRTVPKADDEAVGVVVLEIDPCEAGLPHAVMTKDEDLEFWIRSESSKRRMDYLQIRASFLTPTSVDSIAEA